MRRAGRRECFPSRQAEGEQVEDKGNGVGFEAGCSFAFEEELD